MNGPLSMAKRSSWSQASGPDPSSHIEPGRLPGLREKQSERRAFDTDRMIFRDDELSFLSFA
jgi:hypothetical protein